MPLVYAGIDEAGYGPLLGPLCVGCAAFVLPGGPGASGDPPPCLWRVLGAAVCRKPGDRRRRIAVEDSKKLKGAKDSAAHPLRHLERGVTAFASALPGAPAEWTSDAGLLAALGALPEGEDPWLAAPRPLPVGNEAAALRVSGAMLRTALAGAGAGLAVLAVRAIGPRELNALAARVGNKATINFMAAVAHVDRVRREAAARGLEAWVALDRQGGRTAYREQLQTSFPGSRIRVLAESDGEQRYRLEFPAGEGLPAHAVTASFELDGEARNLPVALASMAAKYARELHMRRLNAFFAERAPHVKPTAGYVEDGRRFLRDVAPVLEAAGIAREALVRGI